MLRAKAKLAAVIVTAALIVPCFAIGYSGGPVEGGATVTGKVTFKGKVGGAKTLKVTKDPGVCGNSVANEAVVVGGGGSLANVVVYLEGVKKGKPARKKLVVLDQKRCTYVPHVQGAIKGSKVELRNSDGVLHNVHARVGGKRDVFNVAMPMQGQKTKKKLKKTGIVSMSCDAGHVWMSAYVAVFDHPYYAVTKKNGAFSLGDVPAGTYKLVAWHEKFGKQKKSITVAAGAKKTVSYAFK